MESRDAEDKTGDPETHGEEQGATVTFERNAHVRVKESPHQRLQYVTIIISRSSNDSSSHDMVQISLLLASSQQLFMMCGIFNPVRGGRKVPTRYSDVVTEDMTLENVHVCIKLS